MHARLWKTQPTTQGTASLESLPIDVLVEIAKLLPVEDLIPFLLTNKTTWRLYKENKLNIPCIKIPGIDQGSFFHANFKDDGTTLMKVYFQEHQLQRESWASTKALAGNIALLPAGAAFMLVTVGLFLYASMKLWEGSQNKASDLSFPMLLLLSSSWAVMSKKFEDIKTNNNLARSRHTENYYRINDSLEQLKRSLRNNQPTEFKLEEFKLGTYSARPVQNYIIPSRPIFRK